MAELDDDIDGETPAEPPPYAGNKYDGSSSGGDGSTDGGATGGGDEPPAVGRQPNDPDEPEPAPVNLTALWLHRHPLPNWPDVDAWREAEGEHVENQADFWDALEGLRGRVDSIHGLIADMAFPEQRVDIFGNGGFDENLVDLLFEQERQRLSDSLTSPLLGDAGNVGVPSGACDCAERPTGGLLDWLATEDNDELADADDFNRIPPASSGDGVFGSADMCYADGNAGAHCIDNASPENAERVAIDLSFGKLQFNHDDWQVAADPQLWPVANNFWTLDTNVRWATPTPVSDGNGGFVTRGVLFEFVNIPGFADPYGVELWLIRHQVGWSQTYTYWLRHDPNEAPLTQDEGVFAITPFCDREHSRRVAMMKRLGPPNAAVVDPQAFQAICGHWLREIKAMFKA